MLYRFEFRTYERNFKRPLQTSHGFWSVRKGIIIRLANEAGQLTFGEIAPISWLGSESLEAAFDFCRQLPEVVPEETLVSIPHELPACQFAFESAWEQSQQFRPNFHPPFSERLTEIEGEKESSSWQNRYSGLLPSGEAALQAWRILWNQGYRTFKWKIGLAKIQEELNIFDQLTNDIIQMQTPALLRLDANGGLSYPDTCEWLQACDNIGVIEELPLEIEFLEQPLPPTEFQTMLKLRDRYSTPIALDESVVTLHQMRECYQQGWRGIFVIKPCIAGSPSQLRNFCQNYDIDAVFSSVMETKIGRAVALKLGSQLSRRQRAMGFGVNHWFEDDEERWLEQLWQEI